MKKKWRLVMAQLDFLVGDIEGNADKIIQNIKIAREKLQADLLIFPELALTGYPPEDLLFKESLYERTSLSLDKIKRASQGIDIIVGYPRKEGNARFNAASYISNQEIVATYHKMSLPNYSVFDEVRYFEPGTAPLVFDYHGLALGITICEDLWQTAALSQSIAAGAKLIISINASPFDIYKHEARVAMLSNHAKKFSVPIVYVNCVGGQDELVFDGGSLVIAKDGFVTHCGPFYEERLIPIDIDFDPDHAKIAISPAQSGTSPLTEEERIYGALVLGVRDYIKKNHFSGAILGLSGGIDSALTLAIAADAIGAEQVEAVLMPSRYTSLMSMEDATAQADKMKVNTSIISIEKSFNAFLETLQEEFKNFPSNVTEENLQARCRGLILMAISNKKNRIVLSTGNKSEISVGYCTLYGDMVGGFCVLKDIPKTLVYRLAEYRNRLNPIIPQRVISRAPSAELAPNQKDQDTLPPYPILDKIIELYIEKDYSYQRIIEMGFDPNTVKRVVLMIDRNEYKRRQAPLGVRITQRAFGRDRRYPITSGYNNYLHYLCSSNLD